MIIYGFLIRSIFITFYQLQNCCCPLKKRDKTQRKKFRSRSMKWEPNIIIHQHTGIIFFCYILYFLIHNIFKIFGQTKRNKIKSIKWFQKLQTIDFNQHPFISKEKLCNKLLLFFFSNDLWFFVILIFYGNTFVKWIPSTWGQVLCVEVDIWQRIIIFQLKIFE